MSLIVSVQQLQTDLLRLGVAKNITLVVHISLKNVGWIAEGPPGVIQALKSVIGPSGTLVMPSMTDGDGLYDPNSTPTSDMGIVAETFWRMPGVLRSIHPNSAFAAQGPLAQKITATHPLADPEGINSPIGQVYQNDGWVLLLGVDHSANTTIHLGESLSHVPYRRVKTVQLVENGQETIKEVPFIDHCCRNFVKIAPFLQNRGLATIGKVGYATAQLMKSRDVVQTARKLLNQNHFFFLCPPGRQCEQCDEARAYAQRCHDSTIQPIPKSKN
ncbi:MAG: AAC(3) family N-acetyltransferase [Anaerolineae bacterium]|nr:AAC(3) family N-acetyltransferase [Anaerolineae bacterium]